MLRKEVFIELRPNKKQLAWRKVFHVRAKPCERIQKIFAQSWGSMEQKGGKSCVQRHVLQSNLAFIKVSHLLVSFCLFLSSPFLPSSLSPPCPSIFIVFRKRKTFGSLPLMQETQIQVPAHGSFLARCWHLRSKPADGSKLY